MKALFRSVTPLIPAGPRLEAALVFYSKHMGYSILWQTDQMAGIVRDGIGFNLVVNDNVEWARNASFSVGVSDLDTLYEEYRTIPADVGPLEQKSWGRREFHVIVPFGVCLQFYEAESAQPAAAEDAR